MGVADGATLNKEFNGYVRGKEKVRELSLLCVNLVNSVVDGMPGIDEETMRMVKVYGANCRNYARCEGRTQRLPAVSRSGAESVAKEGLTVEQAYVTGELLGAIGTTLDFVRMLVPSQQLRKLGNRLGPEEVKLAARANQSFTTFFVNLQERFSLDERGMTEIFESIFVDTNLSEELGNVRERAFPGGVWAVIKSYLHLKNLAETDGWGEGFFFVPPVDDDLYNGIDLGWKSMDSLQPERVFQIKGGATVNQVEILPLDQVEGSSGYDREKQGTAFRNINNYIKVNPRAKAYWVVAPTRI